jgi:hypothetical protein
VVSDNPEHGGKREYVPRWLGAHISADRCLRQRGLTGDVSRSYGAGFGLTAS